MFGFGLILGAGLSALAAPPTLTGTVPAGVTRGKAVEVTFQGTNLDGKPQILSPVPLKFEPAENKEGAAWKIKIDVPADAPLGVFPVRVVTAKGVSNPVLLAVDQLPTVAETEPNNKFEQATVVASPSVVEGAAANNDVDHIRFSGRKGQQIVLDAAAARIGSPLDPTIRLTTARKKFVASADDTPGLATDARLIVTLPEDGEYVVELSDTNYKGTGRANYRLTIGTVPLAEEVFPLVMTPGATNAIELRGGTIAAGDDVIRLAVVPNALKPFSLLSLEVPVTSIGVKAAAFEPKAVIQWPYPFRSFDVPQVLESTEPPARRPGVPVAFLGRISRPGEEDRMELAVDAGAKYRVRVEAGRIGSALDGVMRVLDSKGAQIATGDDSPLKVPNPPPNTPPFTQPDPEFEFTAPAGQSHVALIINDISRRGGLGFHYRVFVEKATPDFTLALGSPQAVVPGGQSVNVPFTVDRAKGYGGPVQIEVLSPPAGLKVRNGYLPAGAVAGTLSLTLDPGAALPPTILNIVGKGDGDLVVPAVHETVFASQGPLPVNVVRQDGLLAAAGLPAPVGVSTPDAPIEVAHGFEATLPIKLERKEGGEPALDLTLVSPPAGLTLAANKVPEKVGEFTATLKSAVETPLGQHIVGLNAKGKLAGADQVVDAPVFKLNVVVPVAFEGVPKEIAIKPGQKVELKGKLVRKPAMKAEVTLTLDALPAGVKAEPVKLAPDKSDFTFTLAADEKAAAATGNATVKTAFKAGDKDYPAQTAPVVVKVAP
ncbi:hypothetical protein GC170_19130 [bacterium]|nr:hypothetical protein [bacterium]